MVVDGSYNAPVVNQSDSLGPAWFGSVQVVGVERVEKVCAAQVDGHHWCVSIRATGTHSWGVPCPGKRGLLNLRRRSGDGSG